MYFDGNSLGRLPRRAGARLRRVIDEEWGRDLARAWQTWIDLHTDVGDPDRSGPSGRPGRTVAVCDSTTVNLYKVAAAEPRPA